MTFIGFENYRISCIIGVYPEEQHVIQDLYIDLRVKIDPVLNDQIEETVCYVSLAELCSQIGERHYQLIETFAAEALTEILKIKKIEWASIRVKKPNALLRADYAFVEMERSKK